MKINQRGFSMIEGLLIIIVLVLIGGVGFFVYNANKESNKQQADSSISKQENKPDEGAASDPTTGWKAYTDRAGHFSLRYPTEWVTASKPELCSPEILLLGVNKDTVGVCASESFGQIAVSSVEGDNRKSMELDSAHYPDLKTETVTIGGVEGKKQTGTYKKVPAGEDIGVPNDGDRRVLYTVFTKNRTFTASYVDSATTKFPEAEKDFDLMVTKTLKFL